MEYQALYRKYRPQLFSEIVGQDHVTATLRREVLESKVSHAYLFAGPRGTGKTTTARVLAKSLNCLDRSADGEPCNKCHSCSGITEGSSLDVIELDAASHNKVEDIREIRVNVGTVASVSGARRVYILDEAHMLSRAASNALLKTLEEPPEHVHFVLATTEPYKLLDTVRSRSQRFDFHPIGVEALSQYLATIADREGYEAGSDGLTAISHHARGSVRDGMGLLEQVAALGSGTVDSAGVSAALGLVGSEAFERLCHAIVGQDAQAGLQLVADVAAQGSDLRRFVGDALAYFRGVFLAHYAPNLEEIVDESADRIEGWRAMARTMPAADVIQAIDQLSEALLQLREGREERLVVELTIIRLTRHDTAIDPVSLAARLDRIEGRLRRDGAVSNPAPAQPTAAAPTPAPHRPAPQPKQSAAPEKADAPFEPSTPAPQPEPSATPSAPMKEEMAAAVLSMKAVENAWPALIGKVREAVGPRRYALLKEATPGTAEGEKLVLHLPPHLTFHLESLQEDQALRDVVEMAASDLLGGRVAIAYAPGPGPAEPAVQASLPDNPPRAPAPADLVGEEDGGIDPAKLVEDILGGEVVPDDGNA
ncbi:MAG: DNA polymerase III subunit gamma/tau [Acidimicrobiia bacterium]|nr:DNA polymerase III subunit gamma/tau [Acidimicrobiia bacterium]